MTANQLEQALAQLGTEDAQRAQATDARRNRRQGRRAGAAWDRDR